MPQTGDQNMSVINTRHDYWSWHKIRKCSVCGDDLNYPFIYWHGDNGLCICAPCCQRNKDGLIADLIQLAAIMDLQKLKLSYDVTLVRSSYKSLEAEAKA